MPGTTVSIGLNSLRMPSGASGFMSHMSCCGGPPHRYSRMQLLALAARGAGPTDSARSRSGSASAPKPAWPKRIIASRRWSTACDSLGGRGRIWGTDRGRHPTAQPGPIEAFLSRAKRPAKGLSALEVMSKSSDQCVSRQCRPCRGLLDGFYRFYRSRGLRHRASCNAAASAASDPISRIQMPIICQPLDRPPE